MRDYLRQQIRAAAAAAAAAAARGRRRLGGGGGIIAAAKSVAFPKDIHSFVDDHINRNYGILGVTQLPQERHLMNLTSEPYHVRRIPHSVHNKLSRHDRASSSFRKSILQNTLSCAIAAGGGAGQGIDDEQQAVTSTASLMAHAGLVGGFNIDETYKYKIEKMAFRDSLIREVYNWIEVYKRDQKQQQQQQYDDDMDKYEEEEEECDDDDNISSAAAATESDDDSSSIYSSSSSSSGSMPPPPPQ